MNGFTRTPGRTGARTSALACRSCRIGLSDRTAVASRDPNVHHHDDAPSRSGGLQAWSRYLMARTECLDGGRPSALNPDIEASMWKSIRSDPPPDTSPVVNFFLWKQSLDPARFDHYHPNSLPVLCQDRSRSSSTAGNRRSPRRPTSATTHPPILPTPSTSRPVAEPATLC